MKKKVAIVGSVGLPANYGGWETLVDQLTKILSNSFEFTVYCSSKKYPHRLVEYNGAKLEYINLNANGAQSIIYDFLSMLKSIRYAETILILGVSGCIFLPILKLISDKKFILNIDGLEWRREKWNYFEKWFLKLSETVGVRYADLVITDNKAIQDYVRNEYGFESTLIAYGGDHAIKNIFDHKILSIYGLLEVRYAFKVCRIEPENNIALIIESFVTYRGFDLVIVGNWNNSKYGILLKAKFKTISHLHLLDPIYDEYVLNQLRTSCYFYIHGHSAGGTNPSLVEAMSLGLPVIAFECIFNRETTCNQALFFNSVESLVKIIDNLSSELIADVGLKMKKLAGQLYTWKKISSSYAELF